MEWLNDKEKVKKVAAIVGIVEGAIYTLLCLVGIIVAVSDEPPDYNEEIAFSIYTFYFEDDKMAVEVRELVFSQKLTPEPFFGFLCFHLILNIAWLVTSCLVMSKKFGGKKVVILIWFIVTLILCVWEFVTSVILMVDHRNCKDAFKNPFDRRKSSVMFNPSKMCDKGIIPVLTITSKLFFIFWIINVFLAYKMFTIFQNMS